MAYTPPGYLLFIRDWILMAQPFDAKTPSTYRGAVPSRRSIDECVNGMKGSFSVSETGIWLISGAANIRQLAWFNRAGQELGPVGAPDAYSLSLPFSR